MGQPRGHPFLKSGRLRDFWDRGPSAAAPLNIDKDERTSKERGCQCHTTERIEGLKLNSLSLFGEEVILDVGEAAHRSFLEVFATLASLSAGRLKRDPKEDLGTAVLKDADRLFRSTSSFGL